MSDLIDRQATIDAIVNTVSSIGRYDNSEVARYGATFRQNEIIDIIEKLPSAQPETCAYWDRESNFCALQRPSAQLEIIRCKECIMHGVCRFEQGLGLNGYCSQAERRTDE